MQRKWRGSRKFAERVYQRTAGFVDPEEERRFRSFYESQGQAPTGFKRFVKEEFEDKDFEVRLGMGDGAGRWGGGWD